MNSEPRQNVAVIGSGIAGIASAYLIGQKHNVTLFEGDSRIGGHTSTVVIPSGPDEGIGVDTGFIVLNNRTYPLLHTLLERWEVPVRSAEMSFGYFDERSGLLYGSRDLNMLLARRRNLVSLDFLRMVKGILKFWKKFPAAYEAGELKSLSLYEFIEADYSEPFIQHYLIPFAAAIWSASADEVLDMPAEHCARFFMNHGMLSYSDNPQWQTVVGGSHSYLKVFEKQFTGTIRRAEAVKSIRRSELGVDVEIVNGESASFDSVVVATHADQALGLLSDPSDEEVRLLGAWKYSQNRTVLHTDTSFLPPNRRGVAAWNYRRFMGESDQEPVCLTYHMNTLQGLTTKLDYCVTLNPRKPIAEEFIVREFHYTHPIFDEASFATQSHLPSLNGVNRTWFCGSYFRWGFHEDAIRSAVGVANDFGVLL